jgi:hypothetical protein
LVRAAGKRVHKTLGKGQAEEPGPAPVTLLRMPPYLHVFSFGALHIGANTLWRAACEIATAAYAAATQRNLIKPPRDLRNQYAYPIMPFGTASAPVNSCGGQRK